MVAWSLALSASPVPGTVVFDEPGNAVCYATATGDVRALRLYDGRDVVLARGFTDVRGVAFTTDGLGLFVAEPSAVLLVSRDGGLRAEARTVHTPAAELVALVNEPDAAGLLMLTTDGRLHRVDPASGDGTELSDAFDHPLAMTPGPEPGTVVVLEDASPGRRLRVLELGTGTARAPQPVADGTGAAVAAAATYPAVLTVDTGTGTSEIVGLGGQPPTAGPDFGTPVIGAARWHSVLVALTHETVEARDWGLPPSSIELRVPLAPAWLSGYLRCEAELSAAGLQPADVELTVEEGPDAGFVSAGLEPDQGDGVHRFVVGAARQPGEFTLACRRRSDGQVLATARFRVVAHWPDDDTGPGIALTGKQEVFVKGSWGGGAVGPQNLNTVPAPRLWRVLMVPLQLKGSRFTAPELTTSRAGWREVLVGGPPPAPPENVRAYYREASIFSDAGPGRGTDIDLVTGAVVDPVSVDIGWSDALEPKEKTDTWAGWNPKPSFWEECANAVSAALTDNGTGRTVLPMSDVVVFLVRTESSNAVAIGGKLFPAKYIWPQAWRAGFWWKTGLSTSFERMPVIFMPDTLPASMPADRRFSFVTATAHELGHTLGLEDLYNRGDYPAEIDARDVANLDLMSSDSALPHFSLPTKMRMGWIPPGWVRSFDFGANPAGGPVTLQAVGSIPPTGPTGGRLAGVEIRIQDKWNYYFEYRRTIAGGGRIGDQQLTATDGGPQLVVGTDVKPDGKAEPARPVVLRLAADADGEGPVLDAAGEDYEETDTTNIARLHDFRLVFDQFDPADPNSARVDVQYVRAHRPELRIAPAPGRGNWKSPDIDLRGPAGDNRVAKGLRHKIVARVHNAGSKQADNVRVSFEWLPFTVSPGTWSSLGAAPLQSVPPGGVVAFEMDWDVPAKLKVADIEVEHFCVKVTVDRYVDPLDPNQSEIVIHNNWAQSNFDTKALTHGSPAERRWSGLAVTNPVYSSALYFVVPEQDSEHVRSYIGHAWLRLARDGSRVVPVATETLAGDPVHGPAFALAFREGVFERPIRSSFNAFVAPPDPRRCTAPSVVWGAGLALRPGLRTWIDDVRRDGEAVRGPVRASEDGVPHAVDHGDVAVVLWFESTPGEQHVITGEVDDGAFVAVVPGHILGHLDEDRLWGEAIFLGTPRYAQCRSGPRPLS
ncbi:hypothetical protein [Georgenia yuyongxinii]|uniref:M6 family metalloprotease domain-containing protein n=1 Tax=Georgenia yuyongxinii TaxID=2589797 RepID=A0A552WUU7_9MICO|nr:hypothetical protein [Georgenia yuyongxinii]TRW46618.1 hypothetical protein FJ693_04865 [Georgenia yuyongxinii]